MDETARAAFLISQAAAGMIEALGMVAANAQAPDAPPFAKSDFDDVIARFGLYHNPAVTWLHGQ